MRAFRFVSLLALTGCLRSTPIEGSACPCPAGYVCCQATQQCLMPTAACAAGPGGSGPAGAGGTGAAAGGTGGSGGAPAAGDTPGAAPLRRLTLLEYKNTVRDLLGDTSSISDGAFAPDFFDLSSGFNTGASITSAQDAGAFMAAAAQIAATAVTKLGGLLPSGCNPVPAMDADQDSCAQTFISQFGLRVFRRPLASEEAGLLHDLYALERSPLTGADFPSAIRVLLTALLQSPYFLYRWEEGPMALQDGPLVRFDSYEIASRLSYFLWASMPDDQLFAAAAAGALSDPDQIAQQARRLLADPRSDAVVRDFHVQWLDASDLLSADKDPMLLPNYSKELAQAMLDEAQAEAATAFAGSGYLDNLLTSSLGYVDGALGQLYGLAMVPPGSTSTSISLDATQRAGILTRGAFLTANSGPSGNEGIVNRGRVVLGRLLCRELDPPANISFPAPAPPDPSQTTRQQFEAIIHPCADACHELYELGYAFENYDGIGAYRTEERGMPVDASGTIKLAAGPLAYKNAVDLSAGLAGADETRDCLARQWLRYMLGRAEGAGDAASLSTARTAFHDSMDDARELLVAITRTRAFTHRSPSPGETLP